MSEISVTVVGSTTINPTVGNGDTVNVTIATTGERGPTGTTGPAGPANTLTIGTVTQGAAAATITGTSPSQVLNLVLQKGDAGTPGTNIELQATGTHIQWRLVGASTWTNLVALSAITGPTGGTGAAGAAVELQASGTHIQWRYVGGSTWTNVVALSSLVGATGAQGPQGPAGPPINLGDEIPQPLGVASAGTALNAARADHVHAVGSIAYSSLSGIPSTFAPAAHSHTVSDVTGLQTALDAKQASGSYATLVGGQVPSSQLPSFVDDVIDVGGTLPASGDVGKIYVVSTGANVNKIYRWSGSTFIEISPSPGSTDSVTEGSTNLYHTTARAAAAAPVQSVAGRTGAVTLAKADVGLGNVANVDATARANHSGTQTAATISDFATEAAKHGPVTSVNGKTGDVTVSGGSGDYTLPTASSSVLGGIKVGGGLAIASGVLSVTGGGGSGEDALLRSLFVPAAPTGLTATAGNAQATLSWNAPTGVIAQAPITGYSVEYTPSGGSPQTVSTGSAATNYTLTGLTNGTAYTVRVAAVNAVGTGSYSSSVSVTPAVAIPDAQFTNVSLLLHLNTDFTDSSLVSNAYSDVTSSDISTSVKKFGAGSYALTSNVYKLNDPAAMQFGSFGTFTIECWVYPTSFPITLWQTFTNTGGLGGHIVVSDANGQLVIYERERYAISASSSTQLALNRWQYVALSVAADACSLYIDDTRAATGDLTPGRGAAGSDKCWIGGDIYGGMGGGYIDEFRVTKNVARYSGVSIIKPTAAFPDFGPMFAPTSLAATGGNAQVSLAWTAPSYNGGSAITDYSVQFSSNGGSTWTTFSRTASNTASQVVSGLTNGTAYVFRVAGINANGTGTYTAASSSVTPSAGPPVTLSTPFGAVTGSGTVGSKWAWQSNTGTSAADSASKLLTANSSVTIQATVTQTSGGGCDAGETVRLAIYSAANARVRTMSSSAETLTAGQYVSLELYCADARAEVWVV